MVSTRSMRARVVVSLLVMLLSASSIVSAETEPFLDVRALTNQADLVVLGTIVDLADCGGTVLPGNNWARVIGGHIAVHQVLKGYAAADAVPFRSVVWTSHLNYIARNTHGVVFLKRTPFALAFVSPVYPMVTTVPVPLVASVDPLGAALESLTAVLRADSPPLGADNELLKLVWDAVVRKLPGDILPIMRRAVDDRNPTVRFNAVRLLLRIPGGPFVGPDEFHKDEAPYRARAIFVLSAAGQP